MPRKIARKQDITPLLNATTTPRELHQTGIWPAGLAAIYAAIHSGELDVIKSRKRVRIICAPLRKRLGIAMPEKAVTTIA